MIAEINIENVGPIEHLTIPVPEGGGVVVLHGGSGVGKTHAIASVRSLHDQTARKALRPSDGFPSGKVEGLGVTVRLGRSNTAKGELVCESLDSGLDPSVLVDPGLKDPLAADSRRLATLVRLAGIKVTVQQWQESVGSIEDVVLPDLVDDDPVVSADKIRRRLHELALLKERIAESKAGESSTLLASIADLDLAVPCDEGLLASELDRATSRLAAMMQQIEAAATAAESRVEALSRLQEAERNAANIQERESQLKECLNDHKTYSVFVDDRLEVIAQLEQQLADNKRKLQNEQQILSRHAMDVDNAQVRLDMARKQHEQIAQMRETINVSLPVAPPQTAIEEAAIAKTQALSAVQRGEVVRRAKATRAKATRLGLEAAEVSELSTRLRSIARSTDGVLEQALVDAGFDTIKVYDGRLCVESDRGLEPVSELSTGERWQLALDLAARGLPKGAILSVQQEGWQALDKTLRKRVALMAKERGLVLITAEVNEGPLRTQIVE